MGFLQIKVFGFTLWLLLIFLGIIMFYISIGITLYIKREWLRGVFSRRFFPERAVKVVIHHRSNIYRVFWRLIPDNKMFSIKGKVYNYNDKNVTREKEFFVTEATKKSQKYPQLEVDGKEYDFNELAGIRFDRKRYIEIHYWYNNPKPIDFNFDKKEINLSSSQLQDFKDNDLFAKLLRLDGDRFMQIIIITVMVILVILNLINLAKSFGLLPTGA